MSATSGNTSSSARSAPGRLLPYLSEADFERIVWGPDDRIIELSKRARFFTGGLRDAIKHRDRHCTATTRGGAAGWY